MKTNIKKILIKEARYQASHLASKREESDAFARRYFGHRFREFLDAAKKGPDVAEKWVEKNW